jgi:GntR family transcriptional regulator, transcriptional repressor for pyruvate dehydrogenase complex
MGIHSNLWMKDATLTTPILDGLTRIERASIKELALEQLRKYIQSGAVKPGERLPAERVLSERLGVGRSSVREALKILEAIGMIESRIGEGTFLVQQSGASIARSIGLSLATWGGAIVEIIEARQMLEVEAARKAALHAAPAEIAAMETALQHMEASVQNFPAYLAADMHFHRLIGQATHNPIVAQITDTLITLLEEALHEGHADQLPTFAEGSGTHREVFDAIARGDGEAAAEGMRRHLQFTSDLWQTVVSLSIAVPTTENGEPT